MVIAIGIIIFFIGCIVSSVEDEGVRAQRRHNELMQILSENLKKETEKEVTARRVTRRRIAQDKEGNVLAEELTEENV